jgi:[citrate (pro-3S)-lyase] ligase
MKGSNMDMDFEFEEGRIFLDYEADRKQLASLLNKEGIQLDKNLEYTIGIYKSDGLIATGSFFKNTLRCFAVDSEYQGLGIMNKVVSHLMNEQFQRGYTHIFLYTKCNSAKYFNDLGFYEIARVDGLVVFMENQRDGIKKYACKLSEKKVNTENVSSIVMNANPFTLGHQYLIEKASCENDVVHVFVVSEEASVIPFKVRYELVKRGTSHLKNVVIHEAGSYIISGATFPSYFIKDDRNVVKAHAELDIEVFKKYIVPALGIRKRYAGEEPYCEVTKTYNEVMKESLENAGVECRVIPRLNKEGEAISASLVRKCIREDKLDEIKGLVPYTTYEYFKSKEAWDVIQAIKNNTGRH